MKLESEFTADHSALLQARGALFAVDQRTEALVFSSRNALEFAGAQRVNRLLGRTVREVLGRDLTHALRNAESLPTLERKRHHIGQFELSGRACDLSVFKAGQVLVMEAVPASTERTPSAYDVLKDVDVLTEVLLSDVGRDKIFARFVALLRTMSGFHCVALDRRIGKLSRTIAVAGRSGMADAACEAPRQLHVLYDVNAAGLGLSVATGIEVPDLGLSALQVPSSDRLSDLRCAGAEACATIGLYCRGEVWGNLKFLHGAPRVPNKRTQFALSHLAPLIGQRLLSAA